MNDERLWAPWRLDYVTNSGGNAEASPPEPRAWLPNSDRECFLCRAAAEFEDSDSAKRLLLVVERRDSCVIVLNRFPYNNGHLLISPRRHVAELSAMTRQEHVECIEALAELTDIYRDLLNAQGFNIGLNLGRSAGAGVPGHLHWHLVPRWAGDNNFMPVVGATRIIPQSLETLWESLVQALKTSKSSRH